jgi:hypothetical protein
VAELSYEVAELWIHMPSQWAMHIDVTQCNTSAELIKLASDCDDQLQASSINNLMRLIQAKMQRQNQQMPNPQRQFAAQIADLDEEPENELTAFVADTKNILNKDIIKPPGTYPFLLANNRSKRMPPRPCQNCGSPLHYDCDCASWKKHGRPDRKYMTNAKTNDMYHKSYVAMLEDDKEGYNSQCDTFNAVIDHDQTTEALLVEVNNNPLNSTAATTNASLSRNATSEMMTVPIPEASTWSTIPVNVAELQDGTECPTEDMYKPAPIWERPAGHTVQGVDTFKLTCHINNLKEPATVVIGDTGAVPTLISQRYLESLKLSKPRPRAGQRLKLLQLTGSAGCSQYVRLNLYFCSQLGPVYFKGVKAYIVKNMEANLLIGKSMSQAYDA